MFVNGLIAFKSRLIAGGATVGLDGIIAGLHLRRFAVDGSGRFFGRFSCKQISPEPAQRIQTERAFSLNLRLYDGKIHFAIHATQFKIRPDRNGSCDGQ